MGDWVLVRFNMFSKNVILFPTDFYHKRYMYHNGKRLPIILESSTRESHQLTNQVLRILLQEIIGYADVNISTQDSVNATEILNRVTGCAVHRLTLL